MPKAFPAFLGRFARLTPVQEEAMGLLLEGRDAVIMAPAASGKTEAALAPLCERILADSPAAGVRLLYLVPTRALSNDIELRARDPAASLGLTLVVRTGDRPVSIAARPPDILVTTPESLDSLLCRAPSAFAGLSSAVVDEAHVLDGTYRGDQLAVLFRRLLAWHCPRAPQRVAMSATIGDPAGLARRLFGVEATVARAGDRRPIRVAEAPDIMAAAARMRELDLSKALVFCNSRREVEETAKTLASGGPWPARRVAVHHGSLSRREREEVEAAFRWWGAGLLVCTNTLEVGIDVGDVDAVVLVGAPLTLASFYQRVGRGCRRKAGMVAVCVPVEVEDGERFADIRRAIESGAMPVETCEPDLSVAVQQAFSILFGRPGGVERQAMMEVLSPLGGPDEIAPILDHLLAEGHLEQGGRGLIMASTRVMDMGERGHVHSNIPDSKTMKVIEAATGRPIGEITAQAGVEAITLAGRAWRVVARSRDTLHVALLAAGAEGSGFFARRPAMGAFARYLPKL